MKYILDTKLYIIIFVTILLYYIEISYTIFCTHVITILAILFVHIINEILSSKFVQNQLHNIILFRL